MIINHMDGKRRIIYFILRVHLLPLLSFNNHLRNVIFQMILVCAWLYSYHTTLYTSNNMIKHISNVKANDFTYATMQKYVIASRQNNTQIQMFRL